MEGEGEGKTHLGRRCPSLPNREDDAPACLQGGCVNPPPPYKKLIFYQTASPIFHNFLFFSLGNSPVSFFLNCLFIHFPNFNPSKTTARLSPIFVQPLNLLPVSNISNNFLAQSTSISPPSPHPSPNYIRSRRVKETELCDWGGRGHDGLFEIFVASEPDVGVINKLRVLGRRPHRNVLPSTIRSRADLVPLPPRFVTGQLCNILAVHLASRRDTSLPG